MWYKVVSHPTGGRSVCQVPNTRPTLRPGCPGNTGLWHHWEAYDNIYSTQLC